MIPKYSYVKDLWIGVALFAMAFSVRTVLALQLPFPQLDDPAGYIQLARNIAGGRGLVSDVLWNYWILFPAVTHPSNEFWMPLASLIMAGSVRVFGDTLMAAQVPGLIAGSLLSPLVYGMGRILWPSQRRWGVLAAVLITIGAVPVYQSVSADSSAVYTLFASLALFSGALAIDRRSVRWMAFAGVLCSLSYLTRSHALLLPLSIGLIALIVLRREPRLLAKSIAALVLGFVVLVGAWSLRNLVVFGSIQPSSLLTAAAARSYGEWFNYADPPSWAKLLADGLGSIVSARLNGLWYCVGVVVLGTFPYGLIGLPIALLRRESLFRVFSVYGVTLLLAAGLIFTVPSLTGSFYHSAGPYAVWGALGCVMAMKYLYDRPRARVLAVAGYALIVGLMVGQSALAWTSAITSSRAQGQQFAKIADWIKANVPFGEPIITTQANTLNYATGHPALTLPPVQDVAVLRQLADRYGVRYVVVTERIGLYPLALNDPAARAKLIATLPETFIYELQR
ncbi:MAG TPA: glycosyltransferase family 39 protein [Anaerolineae bacterium]|nr:glycosyltransferase family 39 protein [Anaerolineae bacterium]